STGLKLLTDQLEAAFPQTRAVRGDRLASVVTGLGLHAGRLFGK
ncbi:MAG: heat-shock protein, partial [Massilia sp.]|nr:heat-shock protein [Aquabacterium sp.]